MPEVTTTAATTSAAVCASWCNSDTCTRRHHLPSRLLTHVTVSHPSCAYVSSGLERACVDCDACTGTTDTYDAPELPSPCPTWCTMQTCGEAICQICEVCGGDVGLPSPPPLPVPSPSPPPPATSPPPSPRSDLQPAAASPPPVVVAAAVATAAAPPPCFRRDCLVDLKSDKCSMWAAQGLCSSPDEETALRMAQNCMRSCFLTKPPPPGPSSPSPPPPNPPPVGSGVAFVGMGMSLGAVAIGAATLMLRRRRLQAADGGASGGASQRRPRRGKNNRGNVLPIDDPDAQVNRMDGYDDDDIIGDEGDTESGGPNKGVPNGAASPTKPGDDSMD